jgi:hypothetical protein
MAPILTDAVSILEGIEERNFEVVRIEADLVSDSKWTLRELQHGWTYGIVAFGDFRIADIDVVVYKFVGGNWVKIQQDDSEAPRATVTISPETTGTYKIEVQVYRFAPGYSVGHYGLIIFHE